MTRATSDRSERVALGRPATRPARVRLDGWARIGQQTVCHYVRNSAAICNFYRPGVAFQLVGTLAGRTACQRCLDRLPGGATWGC